MLELCNIDSITSEKTENNEYSNKFHCAIAYETSFAEHLQS